MNVFSEIDQSVRKRFRVEGSALAGCLGIFGPALPRIDYDIIVDVDTIVDGEVTVTVYGSHDAFPSYEIWLFIDGRAPISLRQKSELAPAPQGLVGLTWNQPFSEGPKVVYIPNLVHKGCTD